MSAAGDPVGDVLELQSSRMLRLEAMLSAAIAVLNSARTDAQKLAVLQNWAARVRGDYMVTVPGQTTRCDCGADIVFGLDPKGTRHPLDPRAPVFALLEDLPRGGYRVARARLALVSHFSTCSRAAKYSRSRKPPEGSG